MTLYEGTGWGVWGAWPTARRGMQTDCIRCYRHFKYNLLYN